MKNTEVQEINVIETALIKNNITNQVLAKLKSDYLGLSINGIEDKDGFKKVEEARKECKRIRVLAEKICKAGREEAIKTQKDWISKEKEVVAEITLVESHLENQSNAIKEEEKRILFEAAQKAKLPSRKEKLMTLGVSVEDAELLKINDEQFNALFNEFHEKHLAEKAEALRLEQEKIKLEKEEAEQKEAARLAEEKRLKDLEAAKEQARIDAENKAKQEIENAKKAQLEAEQRAKEAEEKAAKEKQEVIEKAEREKVAAIAEMERKQKEKEAAELKDKQEAEEKAKADEEARIEAELSKGDKEKFHDLINDLSAIQTKYIFKSKKYQATYNQVKELITKTISFVTK